MSAGSFIGSWKPAALVLGLAVLLRLVLGINGPPPRPSGRVVGMTGYMGSGKTLFCVRLMRKMMKRGRHVAANFTLHVPPEWQPLYHRLDKWEDIVLLPEHTAVFIDEVQNWAPADRKFSMPGHVRWLISHARKFKLDIYWITQHENRVTTGIKEQTTELVRCHKVVFLHRARAYSPDTIGKKKQKPMWCTWYRASKKVRRLYRTMEPVVPDKSVDPDGVVAGLLAARKVAHGAPPDELAAGLDVRARPASPIPASSSVWTSAATMRPVLQQKAKKRRPWTAAAPSRIPQPLSPVTGSCAPD